MQITFQNMGKAFDKKGVLQIINPEPGKDIFRELFKK